ncbi:MAG TPA: Hsp70 family protein [Spirochaetia bacterium]|nr:Hsp70 family protein [Spirochaetia bacterium]
MSDSTLGIKIANGTYYPILDEEDVPKRKRLVLTTAHDDQTSVQIDMYKGSGKDIKDALYIGSLFIENIDPAPKGEPDIDLIMGLDDDGNLTATANDQKSGEHQSLSVSLDSLSGEESYDMPDFEIEENLETAPEIKREEEQEFSEERYTKKEKRSALVPVLIGILVLLVLFIAFFLIKILSAPKEQGLTPETKELVEIQPQIPEQQPREGVQGALESPKAETPVPDVKPEVAVVEPAKDTAVSGGVWYRIRWGDTLWDLSVSFYRNPWLYGKIAKENKIKNPDLIYAGTDIFIPELKQ